MATPQIPTPTTVEMQKVINDILFNMRVNPETANYDTVLKGSNKKFKKDLENKIANGSTQVTTAQKLDSRGEISLADQMQAEYEAHRKARDIENGVITDIDVDQPDADQDNEGALDVSGISFTPKPGFMNPKIPNSSVSMVGASAERIASRQKELDDGTAFDPAKLKFFMDAKGDIVAKIEVPHEYASTQIQVMSPQQVSSGTYPMENGGTVTVKENKDLVLYNDEGKLDGTSWNGPAMVFANGEPPIYALNGQVMGGREFYAEMGNDADFDGIGDPVDIEDNSYVPTYAPKPSFMR